MTQEPSTVDPAVAAALARFRHRAACTAVTSTYTGRLGDLIAACKACGKTIPVRALADAAGVTLREQPAPAEEPRADADLIGARRVCGAHTDQAVNAKGRGCRRCATEATERTRRRKRRAVKWAHLDALETPRPEGLTP